MAFLAGGWVPGLYTVSHSGDAWVGVLAILFFAIAVTVLLVVGNRPVAKPIVKEMSKPAFPKAA